MSRYFLLRKISLCFSQQFKCVCNSRAKFAESFHQMSNLSKGNQTFSLNMLVYEIQSFETRAHSLNPAKSVVAAVVVSWRRTVWPAGRPSFPRLAALAHLFPSFQSFPFHIICWFPWLKRGKKSVDLLCLITGCHQQQWPSGCTAAVKPCRGNIQVQAHSGWWEGAQGQRWRHTYCKRRCVA